jgi:tetratricopeptide (TPR) repeat protein
VLRRHREALANHDKALALAPKWAAGFERRASVYEDQEQWSQVLKDLERYLALGGAKAEVRLSQAKALVHLGREDEAIAALDEAIKDAPKSSAPYRNRAFILFMIGQVDEAIATLGKAVEVDPKAASAYIFRAAYLAYKAGSCARAEDDLRKARDLAPANVFIKDHETTVRVLSSFTCPELAQPVLSLEVLQEATMRFNWFDDYQTLLGAALYANGRYEEAKEALLKSVDLKTKPKARTLFFLAMAESKVGRQDDARRAYDRAVARMNETWPKSPELVLLKNEAGKVVGRQ